MEVKFERLALYAEVWETPLSKLGPKYGMSDNGLRKVCKAMNIPLPRVGHWTRIAANQKVLPDPLPAICQRNTFTSHITEQREQAPPEIADQTWLKERCDFEEQDANLIVVDPAPKKWHPELVELKNRALEAAKKYESRITAKAKALEVRTKSKATGPNWDALYFSDVDEGGMLFDRHGSVVFRVSLLTLHRALAIANTLFFAAESRGCSVGVNDQSDRLYIKLEAASFSIAIRERQEFTLVKRTGFSASLGPEKQYRPTDKLAIAVEKNSGGRFEFVDTTTMRVERRLNDLFIRLYTTVVAARVADRVQKVNDRQRAIAKLAYEEITRQRAVDAQLKAEENARRKALAEESSSWHEAQRIRAYSTHVMNRAEDPQRPEVQQWFAWAMGVADQWDPTAKRVAWFAHPNNSETQTPKESSNG